MAQALRKHSQSTQGKRAQAPRVQDKGWTVRRAGTVQIITANSLTALPWLAHGFSTRPGGVSRLNGERVLNLGFTEWDARKNVAQNHLRFLRSLGAERMKLISLRQIHSDLARVFTAAPPETQAATQIEPLRGDAAITQLSGVMLTVQAADCVPILLVDRTQRAAAAVHAGWRGTLARVAEKTLGRMRFEFGTQPREVIVALGPAIGRCCYDVGPEVAKDFASQFAQAAEWFDGPFERLAGGDEPNPLPWLTMMPPGHQPPPERVQLDLRAANRWQLISAGVLPKHITVSSLCTACRTDLLFSYRREGPRTGRMMAAVGIKKNMRQQNR